MVELLEHAKFRLGLLVVEGLQQASEFRSGPASISRRYKIAGLSIWKNKVGYSKKHFTFLLCNFLKMSVFSTFSPKEIKDEQCRKLRKCSDRHPTVRHVASLFFKKCK